MRDALKRFLPATVKRRIASQRENSTHGILRQNRRMKKGATQMGQLLFSCFLAEFVLFCLWLSLEGWALHKSAGG